MINRREFIAQASALTALSACASLPGKKEFYGPTIRDRLWMWGHHPDVVSSGKNGFKPGQVKVDQAEACKLMGIPNNCVIRWGNLPKHPWGNYFDQFKSLKRFSFGIADGSVGTIDQKMEIVFNELLPKYTNLTGCFLDDFFINERFYMEPHALAKVADKVHAHNLRLSVVLYSDQAGFKPEFKRHVALCDETSCWFWKGDNIATMADNVKRCREFIGNEKDLLLGLYMWDFSCGQPISAKKMETQLNVARKFLADRTVTGLIFHPTFVADLNLDSVRLSKEWIKHYGEALWGC
jgi:hypothetical protein